MKILSVSLLLTGVVALAYALFKYYQVLLFMRRQTYEETVFNNWIHRFSFGAIALFLVGYLLVLYLVAGHSAHYTTCIVSVILFLGAVFVLCMVRVTREMAETISRKTAELIYALVESIEAKDLYTMGHSVHVMKLCRLLLDALPHEMSREVDRDRLLDAALLHDVGKLRIPDSVLNKPGLLDEEEMALIRQHPQYGASMLQRTSYRGVSDWVLYHHERVDGQGYYHLPGQDVPLEARILAVCDTFSALYTDRVYHARMDYPQAIEELRRAAGTQLDPELVAVFCAIPRAEIDAVTPKLGVA